MGYPSPLKTFSRKVGDNVVITSSAFKILDSLNLGARMVLFKHGKNVTVWSPILYGEGFEEGLKLLVGDSDYKISHIVVVNNQHNIGAHEYKLKFPEAKIICSDTAKLREGVGIDYKLGYDISNKLLDAEALKALGVKEESFYNNFEMIYLGNHKNREILLFEKVSKSLCCGDSITNLGIAGSMDGSVELEQYSEKVGIPKPYRPHDGWSFISRYLQPDSVVGKYFMNSSCQTKTEGGKLGIRTAYESWDFERIIMCHGNVIESGAKGTWARVFASSINAEKL
jgi:hypothetical protein